MSADVVTGLPKGGRSTPAGVYTILERMQNKVLRGNLRPDGTREYETPVKYWMRVTYSGVGFHDATWQSQLGSNLYQSIGSHGCVNLSYNVAKEMFNYVEKGMAVICYELPGTESSSITPQSDEEKAQSVIDAINEIATSSKPAKQAANARMLYKQLSSAAKAKVTNYSDLLAYEAG